MAGTYSIFDGSSCLSPHLQLSLGSVCVFLFVFLFLNVDIIIIAVESYSFRGYTTSFRRLEEFLKSKIVWVQTNVN